MRRPRSAGLEAGATAGGPTRLGHGPSFAPIAVRALVAAVALVLASTVPARAEVADYLGKTVASVRLLLDGRDTAEPSLLQVVETEPGLPLSMIKVRESMTHLFALGRFDDVRVEATLEAGGVALVYRLSPVHIVSKFEVTGADGPGIDAGELKRAVETRYGTSPPLGRADELALLISGLLRERGFRQAVVIPHVAIDHRSERATLTLAVTPGPPTSIRTIHIEGTPTVSPRELLARLGLQEGRPYRPDALAARIAEYVDTRRRRGYYEATLTPEVTYTDDDRQVDLTLRVMPGQHVRVVFSGDSLPADRRQELVPVEREGAVDEDLLEDSSNRIEEYLRDQGYRDAKAPHARAEVDGDLVITFAVHRGPQYRVGRVDVTGNHAVPSADLSAVLGAREGNAYSEARIEAGQSAIERLYHGRGFASVSVQVDATPDARPAVDQRTVPVRFTVVEGARTVVGTVRIDGNASIPDSTLRPRLGLQPGAAYFDGQLRADRDQIELWYANQGYQSATVDADAGFSADRTEANPVFTVREGPRIFVGHVIITGNVRTHRDTIERELQLKPGDPLSLAAEYESQRRLSALQLFRRAPQITELRHGDETTRDLLVTVQEAPPTTLGYGGGLEGGLRVVSSGTTDGPATQKIELAPRAFVDLGRRNLFGKNRSVNLYASVSLYPSNTVSASTVGYGFTQFQVRGTFNEPRLFGTTANGLLTATIEQQIRSSYNFARRGISAQVSRRLSRHVGLSGSYQIEQTKLLDVSVGVNDQAVIDRVFTQVRLSSFLVQGFYDTRDDPVDSTDGEYVSANGQLAGRAIGSEVGFAKSFFTGQIFRTLPHTRRVVAAFQARLGIAAGFPRDVVAPDPNTGLPVVQTVNELPEPQRFFAGGDSTVRGFALDTLGRPDTIVNGFPIGGNAETIFNAELRVPVRGGFGVVGFVDAGNVFAHAGDLDLTRLRSAAGVGFRYKSPVGPLRFDLGFKLNPQAGEGLTAWFISFGQAF